MCCVIDAHLAELGAVTGVERVSVAATAAVFEVLTTDEALAGSGNRACPRRRACIPPPCPTIPRWGAGLLCHYEHPAAGRFVQVGIPLSLSVDTPAVRGPAPDARRRCGEGNGAS